MLLSGPHHLLHWWYTHWTWIFGAIVLTVVVRMIVWWVKISSPDRRGLPPGPEEVLRLRWATGELDRREYKRRLELLRQLRNHR